jgi:hypothetical protein
MPTRLKPRHVHECVAVYYSSESYRRDLTLPVNQPKGMVQCNPHRLGGRTAQSVGTLEKVQDVPSQFLTR